MWCIQLWLKKGIDDFKNMLSMWLAHNTMLYYIIYTHYRVSFLNYMINHRIWQTWRYFNTNEKRKLTTISSIKLHKLFWYSISIVCSSGCFSFSSSSQEMLRSHLHLWQQFQKLRLQSIERQLGDLCMCSFAHKHHNICGLALGIQLHLKHQILSLIAAFYTILCLYNKLL